MSLVQRLLLRLLASLALPGASAWYLASTGLPRLDAPDAVVWARATLLAFAASAVVAMVALAAPVARALDLPPGEARARAARVALKLPGRYASLLLAVAGVLLANLFALLVRQRVALDLALAVEAAGIALAVLASLLGHGAAATALAPAAAALGAPPAHALQDRSAVRMSTGEGSERGAATRPEPGTIAGRVLALGCGLALASALLVGAVAYAHRRLDADPGSLAVLGLALLATVSLTAWLEARALAVPAGLLGEAARRVASGDLGTSAPVVTEDELAGIASSLQGVTLTLRRIVRRVEEATASVKEGAGEVARAGERLRAAAPEEGSRALAVQAAVEAMHGSVGMVGKGLVALAGEVHSTCASGDIAAELEEVKREVAELESRSGAAAGETDRLVEASRRAQTQIGSLGGHAFRAQKSLSMASDSLSGLETSAIASQLAAAQAAEMAQQAGVVVKEAVAGIEQLRAAVGDAKKGIAALGRRSDTIDHIVDFIAEVAGRTNLLSLNASIIATQAGEHGKAFGVVADQIGELATQISASTKSIAEIIGAVRDDVSGTARLIDRGDALAGEGVARVRRALDALQEVTAATARGHETAAAIREAVQAHTQSAWEVSESVAAIADGSGSLAEALKTMNRSVGAVDAVSRAVTALAGGVMQSIEQRTDAGRRKRQAQSLERLDGMLGDIRQAVENHDAAARRVREALSQLTRASERNDALAVELSTVASGLEKRSRALAESVEAFKL